MYSQSWLNSCTKVGPYCRSDGTTVVDVLESIYGEDTVEWSTTNDHAKWAITSDDGSNTVCALSMKLSPKFSIRLRAGLST